MTRTQWGVVVWLGVFLPVFLALELPARFGARWPTLSEFVWLSIRWWHVVAVVIAAFMVVLLGHFEEHWRVRYLIAVSVLGSAAIVAHLLVRG